MSNLTSILGSDLISDGPTTINGNFQQVNLATVALQSSIITASVVSIGITSLLSSKVQVFTAASSVLTLTTGTNDKVIVWAKGTITGSASSGSVALVYNGVVKDASTVKQAATADETTFYLMYTESPGALTANIMTSVIATGALTITNNKIVAQVIT